ncbi:MAG: GFA family protein [Maricaulis sp.]|nr:GFA family protein [Maricaulis sp.]
MKQAAAHIGGCQCGRSSFDVTGTPKFVAHCHCRDCRRATGAPFVTWVGWLDHQVEWIGQPRSQYSSSAGVARGFCAQCGSPLSYQGRKWPGEIHLVVGAFEDADAFEPNGEVFADEALHWVKTKD